MLDKSQIFYLIIGLIGMIIAIASYDGTKTNMIVMLFGIALMGLGGHYFRQSFKSHSTRL